jgi:hypothetical protein
MPEKLGFYEIGLRVDCTGTNACSPSKSTVTGSIHYKYAKDTFPAVKDTFSIKSNKLLNKKTATWNQT